ncbi:PrsW family intramembrane metalloprotease [Fulvivirga ligni]|uniref:PrsW family intramembrane metalloprotease n=1 Tax=Fulvivirga ligni TaxID=2904246 RepID=UPI001F1FCC6E|nr:PrsW family intramembrane metalloprotease [Fulvivirga ligni]UII19342.1 PrsW family intramembrane metalloprotease [Fulvivirga ligni]
MPEKGIDIPFLQFHSETVKSKLSSTGFEKYLFIVLSIFTEMNVVGLLYGLAILLIWFYYVKSLDFFNREKLSFTLSGLGLGMLFTFFTFPLSDLVNSQLNIQWSENEFYNLFVYSTIGIGLVEELIKLVPVLIIFWFSEEIDEPIDFIYYGCLSALGFAFIENLLYLRELGNYLSIGRGLLSVVGHMADTTFVVYGLILYKYKHQKKDAFLIFLFLMIGAFIHGLYDFILFNNHIWLFIFFFPFMIQAWAVLINNAINNSKYFDYKVQFKYNDIKFRIPIFITLLLLFNFVVNAILFGKLNALEGVLGSLTLASVIIIFYSTTVSSYDLHKGYWRPIFTSSFFTEYPLQIFRDNIIIPHNHIDKKIVLHCPPYNHNLAEIFTHGTGTIIERHTLINQKKKNDPYWFKVKLDQQLNVVSDFESEYIFIKILDSQASFIHDEHIRCALKLIPSHLNPEQEMFTTSYLSYGNIIINGEDYELKFS